MEKLTDIFPVGFVGPVGDVSERFSEEEIDAGADPGQGGEDEDEAQHDAEDLEAGEVTDSHPGLWSPGERREMLRTQ